MPPRHWKVHALTVLAVLAFSAARDAFAQGDPFTPSLRWTHQAPISAPWIPESAAFAAGGELVWASGNFANPQLMVISSPGELTGQVVYLDQSVATSISILSASARPGSSGLFAVSQYPDPDELNRRTEVSRYDPIGIPMGSNIAPTWTHHAGLATNGPARIAADSLGRTIVVGVWNNSTGDVQLDWLNGMNGVLVRRLQVPASGLNVLSISESGQRVTLGGGRDVYVFDSLNGAVLHHELLQSATHAIAISGDGTRAVFGERVQLPSGVFEGRLRIIEEQGGAYAQLLTISGLANELPTRVALSRDGSTIAIGWWNLFTGLTVRYEVVDVETGMQLNDYMQAASIGMLQGFPQEIRMTADGQRIAFGGWGNGGQDPEVLLVDRGVAAPVMQIHLPGSVRAMDLDPSGTRLIIGSKNAHANQFSNSGELRLYETGERDLALLDQPSVGGDFELAAKRTGATSVVFLVGARVFPSAGLGGIGGVMGINRRLPVHIEVRSADATGRADASFAIPVDARWSGATLGVQALFRVGGGQQVFSETVLEPLIL